MPLFHNNCPCLEHVSFRGNFRSLGSDSTQISIPVVKQDRWMKQNYISIIYTAGIVDKLYVPLIGCIFDEMAIPKPDWGSFLFTPKE